MTALQLCTVRTVVRRDLKNAPAPSSFSIVRIHCVTLEYGLCATYKQAIECYISNRHLQRSIATTAGQVQWRHLLICRETRCGHRATTCRRCLTVSKGTFTVSLTTVAMTPAAAVVRCACPTSPGCMSRFLASSYAAKYSACAGLSSPVETDVC